MITILLLLVALLRPDPMLTPGVANPALTTRALCSPTFRTKQYRKVTQATRRAVFARYQVDRTKDRYEVDHLISIELGGTNDLMNLWPESYTTHPLNATIKDGLENRLHALVCSGTLTLAEAQHAIATDWPVAYQRYVCVAGKPTTLQAAACR